MGSRAPESTEAIASASAAICEHLAPASRGDAPSLRGHASKRASTPPRSPPEGFLSTPSSPREACRTPQEASRSPLDPPGAPTGGSRHPPRSPPGRSGSPPRASPPGSPRGSPREAAMRPSNALRARRVASLPAAGPLIGRGGVAKRLQFSGHVSCSPN